MWRCPRSSRASTSPRQSCCGSSTRTRSPSRGSCCSAAVPPLSWRWVLLINPPIGIAAALVAWKVVADIRRRREGSFDLAGALTLTIGQMVLVYGVVEAGLRSWHAALAIGPILGGLALLMLFT